MATYYWVGGAGTWDNASTANWSATSGGAGGAGVPTSIDTAIFNANSGTGAVTIASTATCLNCSFNGSGIIATLNANHTVTFTTLTVSAGVFDCSTFNMSFGVGTIGITGGTFTCNGGTITAGALQTSGVSAKTISLGASTINLSSSLPINFSGAAPTFNAGTSQINCSHAAPTFTGIANTFYNVAFTNNAITTATINGSGNVFNDLAFAARNGGVGISTINIGGNQTINGTLTVSAAITLGVSRYFIKSSTLGTSITLTGNTASLTDVDFRDITHSGTTWTGTRLGDCGGNSGITFDTPKTVYWNLAGANNYSATGWATTQTGTPATTNFPLPQDTAIFTNTNPASGVTITLNAGYNIGTLDFSARTNTLTFATGSIAFATYGDVTLSSSVTLSGTATLTFSGRNKTQTITSSGKTFTQIIAQSTIGGTLAFADAFIVSSIYTHNNGNLSTNYNLTCTTFTSSNPNTRSISLGSGQLYCTGTGTVFSTSVTGGLTVTGNPTINVTSTGSTAITVNPGTTAGTSNKFNFKFTGGTYGLTISTGCLFNDIDFTGYSGTLANSTYSIYGNLNFGSTMSTTTGTLITTLAGTGTKTISGTANYAYPITFNGSGSTWALQNNMGVWGVNGSITLANGTLDLNGYNLNTGGNFVTASGTKNITFNGGNLIINGSGATAFNNQAPTGFTTTQGAISGLIVMSGGAAKTFVGGGSVYDCFLQQGSTGTLTITGANTFQDITYNPALLGIATTITFPSSKITTFTSGFSLSGHPSGLVTINSSTVGTQAILALSSGTVNTSYLSIKDCNATGGATWNAFTSNGNVDGGNNLGWVFSPVATDYTLSCDYGTYAVTGYSAALSVARLLSGSSGSYAVSGQSVSLKLTKSLTCANGAYSITGQSANLKSVHKYSLLCENGLYSLVGQSAALTKYGGKNLYVLSCETGYYSVAGQTASLTVKRVYALSCANGDYSITGQSANLKWSKSYKLLCAAGSFSIDGQVATLKPVHKYGLLCGSGNYTIAGQLVNLKIDRKIDLSTGYYSVVGNNATLRPVYKYSLSCGNGSYSIDGKDTDLIFIPRSLKIDVNFELNINQSDYLEFNVNNQSDYVLSVNQSKQLILELK